jgi:hypothetical protein
MISHTLAPDSQRQCVVYANIFPTYFGAANLANHIGIGGSLKKCKNIDDMYEQYIAYLKPQRSC